MRCYQIKPRDWFCGVGFALKSVLVIFGLALGQALGQAQPVKVGEVSDDFEITNRKTGEPLKLSDYDGHVVVLDFFAWWCGPCRTSSPDVEKNVAQFFHDRDGNEHGVPVTVIGVNIEEDNPDRTDQFVKDSGMSLVADDLSEVAYKLYNERSAIPLFVILNGVSGNSDYDQWEVLYKKTGYEGATKFRSIINKVKPGFPAPEIVKPLVDLSVELGGTAIFEVNAKDETELTYQWQFEGRDLVGATGPKLMLFNIQAQSQGTYSVIITNEHNLKTTDSAKLTGSNVAPSILDHISKLTVEAGKDAEITIETTGAEPMAYQWFFGDKAIDDAKSSTLFLEDVTLEMSGNYHVKVTNDYGEITSEVTRLIVVNTLQEALDNGDFAFDSGPDETWVLDDKIHTDGEDSARSPEIDNGQSTWVEMEVKGPGTVFFSWRTTNDYGQEFIVSLDDEPKASFEKGYRWVDPVWKSGSVQVGEGEHIVRWEYSKQGSFAQNMYAWLDDVRFLTEEEIVRASLEALGLSEDVPLKFGDAGSWTVEKQGALDEEGALTINGLSRWEEGWIEATLTGPGYLDFHHKPTGQFAWGNVLRMELDGKPLIGSELFFSTDQLGWERGVIEIPEGEHKVKWAVESFNGTDGLMLDWVEFIQVERSEPELDLQPVSRDVEAPGFAFFEVEARGYPFPSYQWYRNDEPIENATARTLHLDNLWSEDEGTIKVVVSNELGEVVSDEVELTVLETLDETLADAIDFEDGKVISISFDEEMQPWKRHTHKSTDGEDSARAYSPSADWFTEQFFAVRIEGPGYITFKWRLETGRTPDELEEFVLACTLDEEFFSSEENNMLAIHTDAKSSSQAKWIDNWAAIPEGMHTVYFTFMKDSEQMGRAYVDQLVFEPAKEGKPESVTVSASKTKIRLGEAFEVGVTKAIGFPIPKFQWKLDGEPIKDATNRVHRVERAWDFDAGNYTVVATNKHGSSESESVSIEVEDAGAKLAEGLDVEGLLFATGGARKWNLTTVNDAEDGDAAKVTATRELQESWLMTQVEGPGVVEFQWKIRSPDETEDILNFKIDGEPVGELVGKSDWEWERFVVPEGRHTLEWTFIRTSWEAGSHMGYLDALEFYVPEDSAPEFTEQPFDIELEGLGSAEFNVEVDGWPFPEFQWYRNGKPLEGETGDTLFFDSIWPEDTGEIWVVAKNEHGEVKSDVVELSLTIEVDADLADALDASDMSFISNPDFEWEIQNDETSDGEDALLVTGLPDFGGELQFAELKTRVEGPGELTFQAKIAGDLQIFRAFIGPGSIWDHSFVTVRDTAVDWKEYKIDIPEGRHTVTFLFLQGPKNGGADSSLWLDAVKFKPSEKPNPETKLVLSELADGKLMLKFEAVPGRTYHLQRSENLTEWELDRELKPEQAETTVEVPLAPDALGQFYRLKSD